MIRFILAALVAVAGCSAARTCRGYNYTTYQWDYMTVPDGHCPEGWVLSRARISERLDEDTVTIHASTVIIVGE